MRSTVMTRAELERYLTHRGFKVGVGEPIAKLREAVRLQMLYSEPISYADIVTEFGKANG